MADESGKDGVNAATLQIMAQEAASRAEASGILMRRKEADTGLSLLGHAPFALLPFKMDKEAFILAQKLAVPFNTLVDRVSRDSEWLLATLGSTGEADDFTGSLVGLLKTVLAEGVAQPLQLGLHRSDYMIDDPKQSGGDAPALLQVELNTISSAFAGLSSNLTALHRALTPRFASEDSGVRAELGAAAGDLDASLPENGALTGLVSGIAAAHRAYGDDSAVVVFVVQKGETNAIDQRMLQFRLWDDHRVRVLRMTLGQIEGLGRLDEESKVLTVPSGVDADVDVPDGTDVESMPYVPVSVGYLRAGYTPRDYTSDADWAGRLKLERSMAINCPTVAYQLVGTKKVQQELARPGQVERFMSTEESNMLRQSFAGLWSLDSDGADEAQAEVLARVEETPERFVLKPMREGGGNNFYGADVRDKLREMGPAARAGYILMQRIFPEVQRSYLLAGGRIKEVDAISELGVFGVFLGNGEEALVNEGVGHLVRTKPLGVDEGGVASGYAVLNTPALV